MEDIQRMTDDEIKDVFTKTIREYLAEFKESIRNIDARYNMEPFEFYIDYFALKPTYSKDDAAKALAVFKKYENVLTTYLDILKMKYKDIEYQTQKTIVSSARIGKGLYVYNFPYGLPNEYVEK